MHLYISFLLFLYSFVHAHNWIHSRSRALKASTVLPAPPKPQKFSPHVRIGQNKEFGIEWATGHPNPSTGYYFIVTHAKHEDKLNQHTFKNLDAYLREAPASAQKWKGDKWQKLHASCTFSHMCGGKNKNDGSKYLKQLKQGDPLYFDRPAVWGDEGISQFQYKSSDVSGDKRVGYKNSKWPWIEAVHYFKVNYAFPQEWDLANFVIEGKEGPGHYLVHMVWRGYRDIVDVDVLSSSPSDIYGSPAGGTKGTADFTKYDHCQFKTYSYKKKKKSRKRCYFIDNTDRSVNKCLSACSRAKQCSGVNVVPLVNPDAVKINKDKVNIPWDPTICPESDASKYGPGTLEVFVCYPLIGKYSSLQNPDVDFPFTIVPNDPEDPIFYSTCYNREQNWVFEGFSKQTKPQSTVIPYKVGDSCISCRDVDRISKIRPTEVPWWRLTNECRKCS